MQKSSRVRGLITLLIGGFLLLTNLGKPIEALHVIDVLKLVAAVLLVGIGIAWLIGRHRLPEK